MAEGKSEWKLENFENITANNYDIHSNNDLISIEKLNKKCIENASLDL